MSSRISSRIAAIAESATLAVDAKAKALKAQGRPVIGFGAGEPDFPTPDYIVDAAAAATRVGSNHRYTPTPGLPELRDAIVVKTKRDSNYAITSDQVLVESRLCIKPSQRSSTMGMKCYCHLHFGQRIQSASN
jgi:aspartate/methionine/tyrosine aminotransferase